MIFSRLAVLFFAGQVSVASAAVRGERRLDRATLGSYEPASTVTDHAAIDQDQKAIEELLTTSNVPNYQGVKAIYEQGAHSKPYATLQLVNGETTPNIQPKTAIKGTAVDGSIVTGSAYNEIGAGMTNIKVKYSTGEDSSMPSMCRVGGLPEAGASATTGGCFAASGTVTIGGSTELEYTYDVNADNGNGRTIQGFSLQAGSKMSKWSEYRKYLDYFGEEDYADKWVSNAIDGTAYTTATGKTFDFSSYGSAGRIEAIKKGTVYFNVYQYVLHEFEDAIADCSSDCTPGVDCNAEEVHAWDEGVAFYTGSMQDYLLYALADKRCQNFGTCGPDGDEIDGTAAINYKLMNEFAAGRDYLLQGNCEAPKRLLKKINNLMAVPLIQGMLRYAYKVDEQGGAEKEKAEGTVFMASVIPRIDYCDKDAAMTIFNNMNIGASSTSFRAVKNAVESQYDCLGITCAEIGGLLSTTMGDYYKGMEPCMDASTMTKTVSGGTALIASKIGVVLGSITLLFMV